MSKELSRPRLMRTLLEMSERWCSMFEDSLVSASAPTRRGAVRAASVVSLAVQGAVAAVICVLPLFHPLQLGLASPAAPLFVPSLRQRPPKIRVPVSAASSSASASAVPIASTNAPVIHRAPAAEMTQPALTPALLPFGQSAPPQAALSSAGGGRAVTSVGDGDGATAVRRGPVRVSSGVSAGLLLAPIRPVYPQIARAARVEGTVVVSAVISREGNVLQAKVTSGPPMLAQAALDAVRAARYRPFRLNGEPTEVETTYSITFRLGAM